VVVKTSGGAFERDLTDCDGSTAAIMGVRSCSIPVSALTAAPFSLTAGDLVVAKVQAHNARGWGPYSNENTVGAIVTTVPYAMAAPVRDGSATDTAQITVTWGALGQPDNGMSAIFSYHLQWDAGSSGTWWAEVIGESTDYLLTHFTVTSDVIAGAWYGFRVRARNSIGWGPWSSTASVQAATKPSQMAAVTSSIDAASGGVYVRFTAPCSNADPISAYKFEVAALGGSWSEVSAGCVGSSPLVVAAASCTIPMSALRSAPFSLVYGQLIQIRASALNTYGWSAPSDGAGALTVRTEPAQMAAPVRGSSTGSTLLRLEWAALTTAAATGGSVVTSYDFQWDRGTGGLDWSHLLGYSSPSLATAAEITDGVVAGGAYQARVRAENVYGFGEWSDAATIRAAGEPDQVAWASLASVVSGGDVRLLWDAPDPDSDVLTGYLVQIRQANGAYSAQLTYCDGLTSAAILASHSCTLPLTVLRAAPYSLTYGAGVVFTVAAYNSYGPSLPSQTNTLAVAKIQTEPSKPSPPTYVAESSSLTSISLAWAALTTGEGTGGSPITTYNLQWRGPAPGEWTDAQGQEGALSTATTATISSGVVGGATYVFRVRAANIHGYGAYSSELTVVASGVPD
jgi:hypothetical protein